MPNLQKLEFYGVLGDKPTVTTSKLLPNFKRLHTVVMDGCPGFKQNILTWVAKCTTLQVIHIRGSLITDISILAACTSLHTLDLGGCVGVSDVSALATCSSLHTLGLACTSVTDVTALAHGTALRPRGLHGIGQEAMQHFIAEQGTPLD